MFDRKQFVSVNNCCSDPVNLEYSVPQGSVLGSVLFVMYTRPLLSLIDSQCVLNQSFADDTQICNSIAPSQIGSTVQDVKNCISSVKVWMGHNKLKLNDDKTEVLLIQTKNSFKSCESPSSLRVGNEDIPFSASARYLGYIISDNMSLDTHVMSVCRSAYCAIRQISSIRRFLTTDATKILVCAFVLSRLDYCNSLLSNALKYIINKLQRVQNCAARLIVKARKCDHITPIFKSLHWRELSTNSVFFVTTIFRGYPQHTLVVFLINICLLET